MSSNSSNSHARIMAPSAGRGAQIRRQLAHFESLAAAAASAAASSSSSRSGSISSSSQVRSEPPAAAAAAPALRRTVFTGDGRPSLRERWARLRGRASAIERPGTPVPLLPPPQTSTPPAQLPQIIISSSLPLPSPSPSPFAAPPIPQRSPFRSRSPLPPRRSSRIPLPLPLSRITVGRPGTPPPVATPRSMSPRTPRTPRTPPMERIPEWCPPPPPAAPRKTAATEARFQYQKPAVAMGPARLSSPLPPLPLSWRGGVDADADVAGVEESDGEGGIEESPSASASESGDAMAELVSMLDGAAEGWSSSSYPPAPPPTRIPTPCPSPSPSPSPRSSLDSMPELIEMIDRAADEWTPSI